MTMPQARAKYLKWRRSLVLTGGAAILMLLGAECRGQSPSGPPVPEDARPPSRSARPLLTEELRNVLSQGDKFMREGDLLGARILYEQAATTGSLEAFLAMGRSFDPSYIENLPLETGKPDPAQAFEWYKRALDGGMDAAKVKIENLTQWLLR